jgi:hypothetical protein
MLLQSGTGTAPGIGVRSLNGWWAVRFPEISRTGVYFITASIKYAA